MGLLSGVGKFVKKAAGFAGDIGGIATGVGGVAGLFGSDPASSANAANYAMSKEFAQKGIRWKVADAKAAGLHPLAALGVQTQQPGATFIPGESFSDRLTSMGQNLSRAANASRTAAERREQLLTEQVALQNDLLRAQTTQVHMATNPPFPGSRTVIDGQGNAPSRESDTFPDIAFAETEQGGLAPVMSDIVKQRTEDSLLQEVEWYLRNRINPFAILRGPGKPPREGWWWDVSRQQYVPPEQAVIRIPKFWQKGGK